MMGELLAVTYHDELCNLSIEDVVYAPRIQKGFFSVGWYHNLSVYNWISDSEQQNHRPMILNLIMK